jgi:ribulose-phosphate 3-epimerase
MKPIKLLPSLLSADFSRLGEDVQSACEAGADALHCDVMDGHFVPNITFGPMVVKAIKRWATVPLDVHLMIEKPELYVEAFTEAGADTLTVHAETCPHLHRTLQSVRAMGIRAGVSLNPSTPLCAIENVLGDIDFLLIMTVNPGFGGQRFIEEMLNKVLRARQMADEARVDLDIGVDGGIDVITAPKAVEAGADTIIAGSSIFCAGVPMNEACKALRESVKGMGSS